MKSRYLGSTYRLRRRCLYFRHSMGAASINRRLSRVFTMRLPLSGERRDDPHCVDQPGHVSEYRQEDIDPEMLGQPHLQEHAQRGKNDREHNP